VSSGFNSARSTIRGAVNSARSALSSAFNSMRSTVSSVVSSITSKVNTLRSKFSSAVSGAVSAIKGAASRMFSAGANLVGNLIRGVTSKIAAFRAKVGELAQAAKNLIGFSSPTKEGPGKTADKWIPNLINMMVGGLEDGVSRFAKAGSNLAGALQRSTMTGIETNINARIPNAVTPAPTNVMFKIDASHMDVDQLGRMLVSKFRSYGIRSQTE
jgi:phage-related protein